MTALRAGLDLLDAPSPVDDEAEAGGHGAAEAVERRLARRLLAESHAIDALAAAVRRGHRDGDLDCTIERHLVPVCLRVTVGRVDDDGRPPL